MALKRNAAYGVPEQLNYVGEAVYDQVKLPKVNSAKKSNPPPTMHVEKKSSARAHAYVVGAIIFGLLSILLMLVVLTITLMQMNTLSELQSNQFEFMTCSPVHLCPELDAPGNGSVTITDSSSVHRGLGSKATYSCDPGFKLVGDEERFCVDHLPHTSSLTTGVWNGSVANCQVQCDPLEVLDHGGVSLTTTSNGQLATYTCDTGYVLVGPNSRECLYTSGGEQGEWREGDTPSCETGIMIDCNTTDCRTPKLQCLDQQGICKVSCNDTTKYPCHQAAIQCPSSGGGCVVDCASNYPYAMPCFKTTITCQGSEICYINCWTEKSFHYSDVISSDSQDSKVDCGGRYSCQYANFNCTENSVCSVTCGEYASCQRAVMLSDITSQCALDCSGYDSCLYAILTGLDRVNCSGYSSCEYAVSTGVDQISCSGRYSCVRGSFSCQYSGNCVNCSGYISCRHVTLSYLSNTAAQLTCSGDWSCYGSTINCPSGEECNIECQTGSSCWYATINCPQHGDCNIECRGHDSCDNLHVICPDSFLGYSCNIYCSDPLSCSGLQITNTANVNLQCCGDFSCSGASVAPSSSSYCRYIDESSS